MNTTTTTPAGAAALGALDFDRVITSRFVTTRDNAPIRCYACTEPLVMGEAFSTVKGSAWTQWCSKCAASFPALIGRFYAAVVNDAKAACGTEVPDTIREPVKAAREEAVKLTTDEGALDADTFLRAYGWLIVARCAIDTVNHAAVVAALSNDPLFTGLALASALLPQGSRHQQAAESIAAQWERKGSISDAQRGYAANLGDMARKVEAKQHAPAAWAIPLDGNITASGIGDGYYAVPAVSGDNDLTFVRIGTSDSGQRFMRQIIGGRPESEDALSPLEVSVHAAPSLDWCCKVLDAITVATPDVAAATYGRHIGRCGLCHRRLTDQTSRANGIGPVCIQSL